MDAVTLPQPQLIDELVGNRRGHHRAVDVDAHMGGGRTLLDVDDRAGERVAGGDFSFILSFAKGAERRYIARGHSSNWLRIQCRETDNRRYAAPKVERPRHGELLVPDPVSMLTSNASETWHERPPLAAWEIQDSAFATTLNARVLRHDPEHGLSTLFFGDGELRVPMVDAAINSGVKVTIFARCVDRTVAPHGRVDHQPPAPNDPGGGAAGATLRARGAQSRRDTARRPGDDEIGGKAWARAGAPRLGDDQDHRDRERRGRG